MATSGIDLYRRQQIEAMSPEQLVLVALEQGMLACRRREKSKAQRAAIELIGGLNFNQAEQAGGLLSLYDWVLQLLGEDRFDDAAGVFDRLRKSWAAALAAGGGRASVPAAPARALPPDLQG